MKELRYLNQFFITYKWRLLLGLIITVIATMFRIVVPAKIGDSVNAIQRKFNGEITQEILKAELLENIVFILGAALLSAFFTFLMRQTIIVVSRYIEFDLKMQFLNNTNVFHLVFTKKIEQAI